MTFWAHSDRSGLPSTDPNAKWQPLAEHLANVSILSSRLAGLSLPSDGHFQKLAACCGLLHDFGKYSDCFQKMILTGKGRCQHAIHGAAVACFGASVVASGPKLVHVALAVAGHHAGLPNIQGGESSLQERVKKYKQEAEGLIPRAREDSDCLREFLKQPFPSFARIEVPRFDLFTRMLFSCLVDADRLDTASRAISQLPLGPRESCAGFHCAAGPVG